MLAPLRLSAESLADAPLTGPVDFAELLGIDDSAAPRPRTGCGRRAASATSCACPSASTTRHEPVLLDLKESSELGMGPHGLCVGATGSGK